LPTLFHVCDAGANNVEPAWFAMFHTVSAFNNAGFALLPDNLIQVGSASRALYQCTFVLRHFSIVH
jgi:Trk-type K+ transport system membrane component